MLAAHPLTRDVPVVATSASDVAGEVERCRAAGFAVVLVKPIDARNLPDLVRRWTGASVGS
jgi:CheY-like chemotaxis protein